MYAVSISHSKKPLIRIFKFILSVRHKPDETFFFSLKILFLFVWRVKRELNLKSHLDLSICVFFLKQLSWWCSVLHFVYGIVCHRLFDTITTIKEQNASKTTATTCSNLKVSYAVRIPLDNVAKIRHGTEQNGPHRMSEAWQRSSRR